MSTEIRESYGEDDVPLKGKGSAFPRLFPKNQKTGKCLNCKKSFKFYSSAWGDKLYCSEECGVAYRKKQRARKKKDPSLSTPEDAERILARRKFWEEKRATQARLAAWDLQRAEEIRKERNREAARVSGEAGRAFPDSM